LTIIFLLAQASHLLKYDSTLGTFNADVKIVDDNTLSVDGKNIRIVSSRDPLTLPWKEMGIDIVIEGTGVFVDSKGAGKHIEVHSSDEAQCVFTATKPVKCEVLKVKSVPPANFKAADFSAIFICIEELN
jgi:glyceraldehyde-3-phosphate dehydrogenase/erythrose-4-phosphate dehydrogenase